MRSCSYCNDVIEYKGYPVELKIYDYYKNGLNQRFVNFCNDKCTMKLISEHVEKNRSMGFLYQLVYNVDPSICDFCGTYTHPPEFCLSHGTKLEQVEKFRKNFNEGEFIGPGACIDVTGSIVRILKPTCFEVDFDIEEYSCRIGTYKSLYDDTDKDNFKRSRLPLACFQENIEQSVYLFEKNGEDLIDEECVNIKFVKGWNIRRIEDSIIDETLHDLTFQHVRKIENIQKMFLPLNILQPLVKYPTGEVTKNEYSTTFRGGFFNEILRNIEYEWECGEDDTVRL